MTLKKKKNLLRSGEEGFKVSNPSFPPKKKKKLQNAISHKTLAQ